MIGNLYAFRKIKEGYCILKCDADFNYLGSYLMVSTDEGYKCSCPATGVCRHIKMAPKFVGTPNRTDTEWFLDFDHQKWVKAKY